MINAFSLHLQYKQSCHYIYVFTCCTNKDKQNLHYDSCLFEYKIYVIKHNGIIKHNIT